LFALPIRYLGGSVRTSMYTRLPRQEARYRPKGARVPEIYLRGVAVPLDAPGGIVEGTRCLR
jgi:hypothetical protein